jgi:hypothetical protein
MYGFREGGSVESGGPGRHEDEVPQTRRVVYPQLCLGARPRPPGPRNPEVTGHPAPRRPGCDYSRPAVDTNLASKAILGAILEAAASEMASGIGRPSNVPDIGILAAMYVLLDRNWHLPDRSNPTICQVSWKAAGFRATGSFQSLLDQPRALATQERTLAHVLVCPRRAPAEKAPRTGFCGR